MSSVSFKVDVQSFWYIIYEGCSSAQPPDTQGKAIFEENWLPHSPLNPLSASVAIRVIYDNPTTLKNMGMATAISGDPIQDTEGEGYSKMERMARSEPLHPEPHNARIGLP